MLVHLVLLSLPTQYIQFKVSYNCQKEKWSFYDCISFCVQKENILKQDKTEGVNSLKIRIRALKEKI